MKQSIVIGTVGLIGTLLAGGCGGEAPATAPDELATAPAWMVQRDLPGCDVYAAAEPSGAEWILLQHPDDHVLVVVAQDDQPRCIDTAEGIELLLQINPSPQLQRFGVGMPASFCSTCSAGPVDDDPIPIGKPSQEEQGTSETGTTQGTSGSVRITARNDDGASRPSGDPVSPLLHLSGGH